MGYWRVTPTFNVKVSGEALIAALGVNLFLLLLFYGNHAGALRIVESMSHSQCR